MIPLFLFNRDVSQKSNSKWLKRRRRSGREFALLSFQGVLSISVARCAPALDLPDYAAAVVALRGRADF